MTSLNNFYLRDQAVSKAAVCLNAFKRVKIGVKVIVMFDLAFDRNQMHIKSI